MPKNTRVEISTLSLRQVEIIVGLKFQLVSSCNLEESFDEFQPGVENLHIT